jgi:hypothetical protein
VRASAEAPRTKIDAVDSYERLAGGFAVLHQVDATVGDVHIDGAEIIGWDPDRSAYTTLYFGSDGPNAYEASLAEEEGSLVWTMRSRSDRFRGVFGEDDAVIEGHWEQLVDDGSWQPWMDITLTKVTG